MDESQEQGRRVAFGRFIERARDRWLDANPDHGVREFCAHTGVSTATLYRWINGTWQKDPERDKVDAFAVSLNIPTSLPHRLLGWTTDGVPVREATEPERDSDVEAVGRKLADPNVPDDEKRHIREMLRFLARRTSS